MSSAPNDEKKKWKDYLVYVSGVLMGDVLAIAWDLDSFSEDQNCYTARNGTCLLRPVGGRIQLMLDNRTGDLAVDPDGRPT